MTTRDIYFWMFAACFFGMIVMCIALLRGNHKLEQQLMDQQDRVSTLLEEADDLFQHMTEMRAYIRDRDRHAWQVTQLGEYPQVSFQGRHHLKEDGILTDAVEAMRTFNKDKS